MMNAARFAVAEIARGGKSSNKYGSSRSLFMPRWRMQAVAKGVKATLCLSDILAQVMRLLTRSLTGSDKEGQGSWRTGTDCC